VFADLVKVKGIRGADHIRQFTILVSRSEARLIKRCGLWRLTFAPALSHDTHSTGRL